MDDIEYQTFDIEAYSKVTVFKFKLASISGTICNFDIEGQYFDIEFGMLRYRSTQK